MCRVAPWSDLLSIGRKSKFQTPDTVVFQIHQTGLQRTHTGVLERGKVKTGLVPQPVFDNYFIGQQNFTQDPLDVTINTHF